MQQRKQTAFTLAELLIALGVIVTSILVVLALVTSVLRSNQKSTDRPIGAIVAERVLMQAIYETQSDATFWNPSNNTPLTGAPFRTGRLTTNQTEFIYSLYSQPLADLTDTGSVGEFASSAGPINRLRKYDVMVWWWDGQSGGRSGYGQLRTGMSRVVNEVR